MTKQNVSQDNDDNEMSREEMAEVMRAHEANTDEATAETAGVNGQEPQATVSDIEQDDEEEEPARNSPWRRCHHYFVRLYWP